MKRIEFTVRWPIQGVAAFRSPETELVLSDVYLLSCDFRASRARVKNVHLHIKQSWGDGAASVGGHVDPQSRGLGGDVIVLLVTPAGDAVVELDAAVGGELGAQATQMQARGHGDEPLGGG